MNVLVTGGAGYIGSVVSNELLKAGHRVTIYDNLSHGYAEAVPEQAELVIGDLADAQDVNRLLTRGKFDAVMHFAALIEAGESMSVPGRYFENNTANTLMLLNSRSSNLRKSSSVIPITSPRRSTYPVGW